MTGPDGPLYRAHEPEPGAYTRKGQLAWRTRGQYLALLRRALDTPRGRAALDDVDVETFMRWASVQTRFADPRNGRECRVRPDRVARLAGLSERHVQRCRSIARALGTLDDVLPGRRLTARECAAARGHEGGHLAGFSTVSAFVIPRWLFGLGSLSPLPEVGVKTTGKVAVVCGDGSPSGHAERREAAPSALTYARGRPRRPPRPPQTASQRAALALSRALVARVGWLDGCSPWRLLPGVRRFAAAGWSADDVVDAIDVVQARCGYTTPPRDTVRRPWALLAYYLRGLDPQADHPRPELLNLRRHPIAWCGTCDPLTRLHGLENPRRCPRCHPLACRS